MTDPNNPALRSFVDVPPDSHFPIQNLPFGVFSTPSAPAPHIGIAIGDYILDLSVLATEGYLQGFTEHARLFSRPVLNDFISAGRSVWTFVRQQVSELLRHDNPTIRDNPSLLKRCLVPAATATMHLPIKIGGYTDFYSSRHHAANVGMLYRDPANALSPNWLHMPIGYNGRASSVVVSGTGVKRPYGQIKERGADSPAFLPSRKLDFELEMGFIIGKNSPLGTCIDVADAENHIFGMVLVNDWSARDIQQWEYMPLGPFNAKSFATSISPWIVTLDALKPFKAYGPIQEPMPLEYLQQTGKQSYDIVLETSIRPKELSSPVTVCRTNFRFLYWSMSQQLAHHTVSGCNTQVGDLMASGTISGPDAGTLGCMLEITRDAREPLKLTERHVRTFLEDEDEVTMTGWCPGTDYRVGFGELKGVVLSACPSSKLSSIFDDLGSACPRLAAVSSPRSSR